MMLKPEAWRLARLAEAAYPADSRKDCNIGGAGEIDLFDIAEVGGQFLDKFIDKQASVEMFACRITMQMPGDAAPREYLVISHRGTKGYKDGLRDLDVTMFEVPGIGMVHSGFWTYYETAKEWIAEMVERYQLPVIHVGHSLGGASACCAAADSQSRLVTFGCPVVGDRAMHTALSRLSVCERFFFVTDIVSYAPGAIVNWRFGTTYDWKWTPGARRLGIGRHSINWYVRRLS